MQFTWLSLKKINDMMAWWHDAMKNKRASTKETHGDHKNMEVFWSVGLGALQKGHRKIEPKAKHFSHCKKNQSS